jgi:hypothetical protein
VSTRASARPALRRRIEAGDDQAGVRQTTSESTDWKTAPKQASPNADGQRTQMSEKDAVSKARQSEIVTRPMLPFRVGSGNTKGAR